MTINILLDDRNPIVARELMALLNQIEDYNVISIENQPQDIDCYIAIEPDNAENPYTKNALLLNEIKPFSLSTLIQNITKKVAQKNNIKQQNFMIGQEIEVLRHFKEIVCKPSGKSVTLTDKEVQILELLTKNPDQAFNKTQLLTQIWGYHETSETHTVETHIYRLRHKLSTLVSYDLLLTKDDGYAINPVALR